MKPFPTSIYSDAGVGVKEHNQPGPTPGKADGSFSFVYNTEKK